MYTLIISINKVKMNQHDNLEKYVFITLMCFQTEKVTTVLFGFIIPVLMACLAFHTATDLSRKASLSNTQ